MTIHIFYETKINDNFNKSDFSELLDGKDLKCSRVFVGQTIQKDYKSYVVTSIDVYPQTSEVCIYLTKQ